MDDLVANVDEPDCLKRRLIDVSAPLCPRRHARREIRRDSGPLQHLKLCSAGGKEAQNSELEKTQRLNCLEVDRLPCVRR